MRKCSQDISDRGNGCGMPISADETKRSSLLCFVYATTRGYRLRLIGLLGTVLITALTASCFNMVIGLLVDAVLYRRDFRLFFYYFAIYAGLYLVNQAFHGGLNYLWAKLKITYLVNIRRKAFRHLMKVRADQWNDIRSGDILQRLDGDVECILELIHRSCFYTLENGIQFIAAFTYLTSRSLLLGGAALVIAPAVVWGNLYFTVRLKERNRKLADERGKLNAWQMEMLSGMEEVKLLGAGEYICDQHENRTKTLLDGEISISFLEFLTDRVNTFLLLTGRLMVFGYSGWLAASGKISVGDFVACAAYYESCVIFLKGINNKLQGMAGNLAGTERVKEIFDMESEDEVNDDASSPQPSKEGIKAGVKKGIKEGVKEGVKVGIKEDEGVKVGIEEGIEVGLRDGIEVRNVSFSYSSEERSEGDLILQDVTFTVKPGERIALVGKSGDGKSTLLQLLFRLYDARSGEILFGSHEIRAFQRHALRRQLGIVLQHPVLFRESIRYNICLKEDPSQDEVLWELLEDLCLRERIEKLPLGLKTVLGQDLEEDSLSGGERQRLAVARALWKRPAVVLLDEATSALDGATEEAVNNAIWKWAGDACIVYAAHRFATILQADRIVVLKEGAVAGIGRHEELLEQCEEYRTLYAAIT